MKITIVGLGVVGGSFAMALQRAGGHEVYGVDSNEQTIQKALNQGLIVEGGADGSRFFEKSDLILLCLYPDAMRPFLLQYGPAFRKGCVVTDTAGIKSKLIEAVQDIIPPEVDFVFGHPMAGREKRGIDFASDKVFQGANYIITPVEQNKPESIQLVQNLMLKLGFGRVTLITPEEHDYMISYTSQLPHAIAVALVNSDEERLDTGRFVGDSYRELTRIANINEQLWCELFFVNKQPLLQSIEGFERELDRIKRAIAEEDTEELKRCFVQSSQRRQRLDRAKK